MGGSLNANHLMFLGYGALWTIGLSLIGLLGGGIAGFVIALCRISPSTPMSDSPMVHSAP